MPDGRKDEEADEHPAGARDEGFAAAVVFDDVEAVEGYAEVDAVLRVLVRQLGKGKRREGYEDHLCDEGVADAGAGEDGGTVVEEVLMTLACMVLVI